ncbi:DUF308 domain-containing protein [Rhizobium laguerreae]|uniref:DUF308 domain-containing protein n=1 Tax=Rhizobium laguerreae TaxID=1076926 RepID=A0AB35FD45_9HYPH|nr:DUF308 domain-containing protein [Rhizobium laguerreae]MBY3064505.1 DUF308 domain-containing protein [Rhizobium laguerreae]
MTSYQAGIADDADHNWLQRYSYVRAGFSFLWVVATLTLARENQAVSAALLIGYPAWDAGANLVDALRNGGLTANKSQAFNVTASTVMTIAVAVALTISMNWVLAAFGLWAVLSGLLQLSTAVRRWKTSGGQSALAGVLFLFQARMPEAPSIANVAGYAAFGAIYFLVTAVWLTVGRMRSRMS